MRRRIPAGGSHPLHLVGNPGRPSGNPRLDVPAPGSAEHAPLPFALCPLPLPVPTHYALPVDWQQIAALGVVGVTVTLMAWRLFRPRRLDFRKTTGCGCGSTTHPVGLVITGRRGETPRILLKTPPR